MGWALYDWLLTNVHDQGPLRRALLGLQWSIAESAAPGLCFSPSEVPRTLAWSGTLAGQSVGELARWVRSFDPAQACVGVATLNSAINTPDTGGPDREGRATY